MKNDIFGLKEKKSPYKFVGVKDVMIQLSCNADNWEKYLTNSDYDKYYNYFRCVGSNSKVWYMRKTKKEWRDKITNDMEHLDIKNLEKLLNIK